MTKESSESRSAAIRARAEELAASGNTEELLAASEILAGIADGSVAFDDLDDEVLDRMVKTLGMDTVTGTIAAIGSEAVPEPLAAPPVATGGAPVAIFTPKKVRPVMPSFWQGRAPVWIGAAASVAIVAAALSFRSGPQSPETTQVATGPSGGSQSGQPGGGTGAPFVEPTPGSAFALQWIPQSLRGADTSRSAPQVALQQALPDFEANPAGGATLGSARQNRFLPMQLATVIVRSENGWGSGAFISADGWLLTNYHVVEEVAQKAATSGGVATLDVIAPTVVDGRVKPAPSVKARLYRADPVLDLALLKLEQPPGADLPHFTLANTVEEGGECIVIGSQGNGPAWWVRSGIVSQQFDFPNDLSQYAAGASSERPSLDRNRVTVIVTDTRISGGDSGGPLLNDRGELIGLTFATSANATSGSVGWHVALPHLRSFIANLPAMPEGVPFDSWTAGLGESVGFQSQLLDGDRDGRPDSVAYVYAEPAPGASEPQPLGRTLFVDFRQRTARSEAFQDRIPFGLWGMDGRGRFRFDVFLSTRADGTAAVGYTNEQGIVDEMRLGRVQQQTATAIWRRSAAGRWQVSHPSSATPLVDGTRLGPGGLSRLQAVTGEQLVAGPAEGGPRGGGATQPGRGRGANKM